MRKGLIFTFAICAWSNCQAGLDCNALEAEAIRLGAHIPRYQSGADVIGKGKAQLYSAPNSGYTLKGKFISSGATVNRYVEYKGYTAVMYKYSDSDLSEVGWLVSRRVKSNGFGIAPNL